MNIGTRLISLYKVCEETEWLFNEIQYQIKSVSILTKLALISKVYLDFTLIMIEGSSENVKTLMILFE